MGAHVSNGSEGGLGVCGRLLRGRMAWPQVWQRRRGLGARGPGAVETLVPVIAGGPQLRVEGRAVGRRLGREDEGIGLQAVALVGGAHNGPQVDDAVVHVGDRVGAAGRRGIGRRSVDGAVAGGASPRPPLQLFFGVLDPSQASRVVCASLCGVCAGQKVALASSRGAWAWVGIIVLQCR